MKTGSQNRPYREGESMKIEVKVFNGHLLEERWTVDWNDRNAVRQFASKSDRLLRDGFMIQTQRIV